ncbi:basal cell adhesion molecule-like [Littorina saxatilis]|uniref:Ig-like domain-containing protein n=1 Tax=Littorina saxatilis TaxID=31220 RepID=A0AAN9GEX2_9CAEN
MPRVDRYVWATPGTENKRCETGTPDNVCTFTPRLEDDNSNATCLLLDSQGVTSSRALYMVNLKYPPQSSPNITIQASQTEPLKQGDNITCTVSGGKPRVSSVIIYCQYPDHKDQEDVVGDDEITVTSSIMVNTSQSTDVNTTCTCYANWPPEPGLYTDRTVMSLQLEYKAKVTNFTINGTTELTLNETSHSTVIFACQGDGRPPPVLRLYKQGDDTALIQAEINADTQQLVYTIDNVRGEDLATYTCEADNGFQDLSTRTVLLWVNYKAKVTNFTINGTTELTLNETSHSTVIFACQGDGRPPPVLRLFKQGDDTALIQAEIDADAQLVYTIDNVRGEDLATYTCEADNGFQDLSTRTVLLWVNYKAKVTNFTINGTTELTLNETSHSTVIFACQGDGRPPPVLRLYKQGDDTALIQAEINADTQQLVYTIDNVRGEDLATYTCEADNGFQDLSTRTVLLWVNSAPRILDNSSNFASPPILPPKGLTFSLVAYPTPQFNGSYFLGTSTKPEPASENTFEIQCTRNALIEHLVTCNVTPQNVPKENVGLYEMSVTNELGEASFRFRVGTPVSLPQDDDSILTVAIVVAVVGVLLVIGIIVVIVICLKRRKLKAGHKGHHDSPNRNQNDGTTVPVTMTATTVAQVSLPDSNATDTNDKINDSPVAAGGYITVVDVGKKGQRSTDSKEYANVDELTKNGNRQGSNNAASTLRNNVQTLGYENLTLNPIDAPKVMTTAEKPDIVASIPEDSAEETNRPESEAYAVVAPKPKGDNQHIA